MKKGKEIKKILIPNRGEIAIRIQRTCREMKIPSVAVFSDPDRQALHVRYADEAHPLEGTTAGETYLNQDKIIHIAHKSGANAIHPGYGFLSENPEFVERCSKEGIIFIGPPTTAIMLMGLKTTARAIMLDAGIPVIPGSKPLENSKAASREAKKIGYPVLVKASAGGGGKGMRLVEHKKDLAAAFEACTREAQSAFGDPSVYLEKYLKNPRHVEFQILADQHGNVCHLYERECSIQRRHQKIIEETPSPAIDEKLREQMAEMAMEVARVCSYTNAGTVEFLVDQDKNFYFLEMNTRLQVEHPITEMVTGTDIVAQQIEIAQGKTISPEPVQRRGVAMECRIYAEDPENNFLPSPGLIRRLTNPGGPGIRNDSGVYSGYTIPLEYDPMISKLVAWGATRQQVVNRMLRALGEYHVLGIKTNIAYLRQILLHPQFQSGNYDTHFINNYQQEFDTSGTDRQESVALAAAALVTFTRTMEQKQNNGEPAKTSSAWKERGWKRNFES